MPNFKPVSPIAKSQRDNYTHFKWKPMTPSTMPSLSLTFNIDVNTKVDAKVDTNIDAKNFKVYTNFNWMSNMNILQNT